MAICWYFEILDGAPDKQGETSLCEDKEALVGRLPGANLVLGWDKKVSRLHAMMQKEGEKIRVVDLKSTNGTYVQMDGKWHQVEGQLETASPAKVRIGDTVMSVKCSEVVSESVEFSQSLLVSQAENVENRRLVETIMVLDLCKSSDIANLEGDELAYHLKKRLFRICDSVFAKKRPTYRKSTGDGFYAVFDTPVDALNSGIEILQKLKIRNRMSERKPIDVRIGIHHGETFILDDVTNDRHGNDLNIAFRIEGVEEDSFSDELGLPFPGKNRLLASSKFLEVCHEGKHLFRPLGTAKLKGIQESMDLHILQLDEEGK